MWRKRSNVLTPGSVLSSVWLSQSPDLCPVRIRKHSLALERAPLYPTLTATTFVGFGTRAIISYLDCDSDEFDATCPTHSLHFLRTDINDFPAFIKHCLSHEDKGLLSARAWIVCCPTFGHIPQWQNLSPQGLVVQVSYTPFFVYFLCNLICNYLKCGYRNAWQFISCSVFKICAV